MCKMMEDMRNEAVLKDRAQIAENLIKDTDFSDGKIAKLLNLPEAQITEIRGSLQPA